jgi:hypothetical protein
MKTAAPKPEAAIARWNLLTLVGTTAAGFAAAGSASALSPALTSGTASAPPQAKSTVMLDRLPIMRTQSAPTLIGGAK